MAVAGDKAGSRPAGRIPAAEYTRAVARPPVGRSTRQERRQAAGCKGMVHQQAVGRMGKVEIRSRKVVVVVGGRRERQGNSVGSIRDTSSTSLETVKPVV